MVINKPKRKLSQEERDRRNKRRRANLFPRVLKRDPRRNYAQMFVNVFNLADFNILTSYIDRYYSPLLQMSKRFTDDTPTHSYQTRGRFLVTNFLNMCYSSMPDVTMKLVKSQIRIDRKTNGSVIIMKVKIVGTMIACRTKEDYEAMLQKKITTPTQAGPSDVYDLQHDVIVMGEDEIYDEDKSLNDSIQDSISESSTNSYLKNSECDLSFESPIDPASINQFLLPKPLSGTFEPYISLYLDSNLNIEKFEMLLTPNCMTIHES